MSQGTTKGSPIDVDSTFAQNSDQLVPSQRAVKTAIDLKEDVANKQDSLLTDGTGDKYPTVDAINLSWTEAVRNASGITQTGYRAYNTDKDRYEYYDPFWGWSPMSVDGGSRDWGFEAIEDFHLNTPYSVWLTVAVNSGSMTAIAGYFGVVTISTQVATNGGFQIRGALYPIQFGGGQYRWDSRVRIPTNSTGVETFQFICGFWDVVNSVNQVDGIYFLYDSQGVSTGSAASGNWQIVTSSNSVRTFTTTTVAIDNTNLQKLRIDVNALATSVTFYIDNVSVGTHITNIPSGASRLATSGVYLQKSAGTTARTADVDYLYLKAKFTTPR